MTRACPWERGGWREGNAGRAGAWERASEAAAEAAFRGEGCGWGLGGKAPARPAWLAEGLRGGSVQFSSPRIPFPKQHQSKSHTREQRDTREPGAGRYQVAGRNREGDRCEDREGGTGVVQFALFPAICAIAVSAWPPCVNAARIIGNRRVHSPSSSSSGYAYASENRRRRMHWSIVSVIAGVGIAALWGVWWLWWRFPKCQVERLRLTIRDPKAHVDVEDNLRKTITQVFGGIVVLFGGAAALIGAGLAYYGTLSCLQPGKR